MTNARWDRIKEVFNAALAVPQAERPALIERLCAGDEAIRREVESLLEARTLSIVRTGGAADALAGMTTTSIPDPHAADRVGTMIARYKLLQIIGEGGFGTVYMAEQTEPVRRKVALKVIKPGMDSRAIVARFEAERQVLAIMDHPHIARVLDGGMTPLTESGGVGGGLPYFVMEYVVGDPITKFADAHALSIRERLDLFQQVCSAVQHAHTKGIIHRDLKPANVIASMVDDKPFAKVIDFGIAKATGAAGGSLTDKTLFTEHRQLIGTPEYMSPEQAEGSPDIDTRTDVYALGVLLYELLTGTTPIESARLRSAAFDEMRRMIREDEPLAPSLKLSRSLEKLASTAAARKAEPARLSALIKGELDWIVMKALEKERARRYETASALAADVQRHLAGEAIIAAPVSRAYRVRKFVRKNKGPVAAVSAVVLALVAGGSVAAWQWREARTANSALLFSNAASRAALVDITAQTEDLRKIYPNLDKILAAQGISEHQFRKDNAEASVASYLVGLGIADERDYRGRESEALARLAVARVKGTVELRDKLATQTAAAKQALSEMFLAGIRATSGMASGLPAIPEIRGEPGSKLLPTLVGDGTEASPHRFEFQKMDAATQQALPIPDDQLIPALADSAKNTLLRALAATDEAEWSAYTANLALAQSALAANDYPEARKRIPDAPESKRGWEWEFFSRGTSAHNWKVAVHARVDGVSADGKVVLHDYGLTGIGVADVATGHASPGQAATSKTYAASGIGSEPEVFTPATGSDVRSWSRESRAFLLAQTRPYLDAASATLTPDGKLLIWQDTGASVEGPLTVTCSVVAAWGGPERILNPQAVADASATSGETIASTKARVAEIRSVQELHLAAVVASSPNGPCGLSITTPDGTRRIVGGSDKTVRFYEAKDGKPTLPATAEQPEGVFREVAVFRMPEAVTNLQMTGDGTRLIIHLQDGSARVWDIRDPEERRKDLQAEWAERGPAGAYLDTLWASDTPDGKLYDAVINDASLTPLRRLVAAEMLEERLEDDRLAAEQAFGQLRQAAEPATGASGAAPAADPASITAAVRAAAAAAELPKRVKARVVALAAGWEYRKPDPSDAERLAAETQSRQLAEARLAVASAENLAAIGNESGLTRIDLKRTQVAFEQILGLNDRETIAVIELRASLKSDDGDYSGAVALLDEAAARRRSAGQPVGAVDLRLWTRRAYAHWVRADLASALRDMHLVGSHLNAVWTSEPGAVFYVPMPLGAMTSGGLTDKDQVADMTRRLSTLTLQDLTLAWSMTPVVQGWQTKLLERSDLIMPVNVGLGDDGLVVRQLTMLAILRRRFSTADDATLAAAAEIDGKPGSLTGGKVLDREGHRAAAREALAKARALMAPAADGTPSPWANDEHAKALLAEAEALIEPREPKR
jgi:serine/threonine protein kinase